MILRLKETTIKDLTARMDIFTNFLFYAAILHIYLPLQNGKTKVTTPSDRGSVCLSFPLTTYICRFGKNTPSTKYGHSNISVNYAPSYLICFVIYMNMSSLNILWKKKDIQAESFYFTYRYIEDVFFIEH